MSKKVLTISIILVLAVITFGVVFGLEKREAKAPVIKNNEKIKETTKTASTTKEIDTSDWALFNSEKDAGLRFYFTVVYPRTWITKGSIDGGNISFIPFYKKNEYNDNCGKSQVDVVVCDKINQVAHIKITKTQNNHLKKQDGIIYVIDGYDGYINSGINKSGVKGDIYTSDNKMWVNILVGEFEFEFIMAITEENDKNIFYEVMKNIKFN